MEARSAWLCCQARVEKGWALLPGSLIDNFVALLWLFKKSCEVNGNDTSLSHKCHPEELFFLTCSFRRLLCQIFKNKMFYRREGIWQHCWPTFQKENEKYRGQIAASGGTMSTYAVNEVEKLSPGTSNFHNHYTAVKWILSNSFDLLKFLNQKSLGHIILGKKKRTGTLINGKIRSVQISTLKN